MVAAGAAFANIHWMPPVEADLIIPVQNFTQGAGVVPAVVELFARPKP